MLIRNDTPFAAIGFGDLHRDGMSMAVIAVRASYILSADELQLANAQSIVLNDVYGGDSQRAPLVQVGDLIPYKPAADVTVLGFAYAPGGRAAESWNVGIAVGDHRARLYVHGPRRWEPTLHFLTPTWKLGSSAPAKSVELDYRLAAGGYHVGDGEGRHDTRNPIGPGLLRRDASRVGQPLRAPQIEAPGEVLADPFAEPEPRGFGPVSPSWAWRERHLGTRDEAWQKERCPQMPVDFDYRFFQCAHPDLILPHLRSGEVVRLEGLVPGGGAIAFKLPGQAVVARHSWRDGRSVAARLTLDGLHLDLRKPGGPWLAHITWRGWVERCPAYEGAIIAEAPARDAVCLPGSGQHGLEEAIR